MQRKSTVKRETKETQIEVEVFLDGKGKADINTGFGFLDHMLEIFSKFSNIDLKVKAKGDLHVDEHHLVEDTGICIGQAIKEALGDKKGIKRFGFGSCPMDETLTQVSVDISGRPCLIFNVPFIRGREGSFETEDAKEFLKGFVNNSGITLHVNLIYGENLHHINESIFKSFAIAMKEAIKIEGESIPSTKGMID